MTTNPTSVCGSFLDDCRCRWRSITPRKPAEIQARHQAAVARARRSGWGAVDPTGRRWAS